MSNGNHKRTLLDRSIVTILPDPDQTPSHKAGIDCDDERLYRLSGTSLMEQVCCHILKVPQIYPTATVLFHRFFHQVSFLEANVWSVSMACTLLAAKIEEVSARVSMRQLVLAYVHLYRRRSMVLLDDDDGGGDEKRTRLLAFILNHKKVAYHSLAPTLSLDAKRKRLETEVPPLSMTGPVWKEWHDAVIQAESRLLRQLGFTFYWIPNQHPHRFVSHFCQALVVDDEDDQKQQQEQLTDAALHYCNQSCRLDLCVRYAPEVVACAAIYLALLLDRKEIQQRTTESRPWWHVFCGHSHDQDLSIISNVILGLLDQNTIGDVQVASTAFLKSHGSTRTPSFNDPGSFVWEMLVESSSDDD